MNVGFQELIKVIVNLNRRVHVRTKRFEIRGRFQSFTEHFRRAHEILSELSEENRDRFSGVVDALRKELRQE